MKFDIQQKEHNGDGVFFIQKDGNMVANLEYSVSDKNIMTLHHTEAKPEMKGTGAAGALVKHSVNYAREKNLKIDPVCDYAAHMFEKHKEYQEVQA